MKAIVVLFIYNIMVVVVQYHSSRIAGESAYYCDEVSRIIDQKNSSKLTFKPDHSPLLFGAVVSDLTMSQSVGGHAKIAVPQDLASITTNQHKKEEEFRVYNEATSDPRVVQHYKDMRLFQTVDIYRRMENKFSFDNGQYRRLLTSFFPRTTPSVRRMSLFVRLQARKQSRLGMAKSLDSYGTIP